MKHSLIQKTGFTLIEALVAISMLTLVIATVMGLAQSSIAANSYAQAQISANYLAGEAIEYIRNIRDTNFINGTDWLNGIPQQCFTEGCDVDTINITGNQDFISCTNGCPLLKFSNNITTGFYHHKAQNDPDSTFRRKIKITKITNKGIENEIMIQVTISSDAGYFKQTPLVVVEHLFNWYKP